MACYLALIRSTDQDVKQLTKSTARAQDFARSGAKTGVTVEAQYWTNVCCDGVLTSAEQSTLSCMP